MDALFERAAALRRVELLAPRNVIGKSTVESIQSGAVFGYSGQVDALVERFQAELGQCTVLATGGLAEPIIRHSRTIQHYEPWLTLQGLRIIFERNSVDDGRGARAADREGRGHPEGGRRPLSGALRAHAHRGGSARAVGRTRRGRGDRRRGACRRAHPPAAPPRASSRSRRFATARARSSSSCHAPSSATSATARSTTSISGTGSARPAR